MIISGWRTGAKTIDAIYAIKKHTDLSLKDSKRLVEAAIEGNAVTLPDDFVLREDLEDFGFILE